MPVLGVLRLSLASIAGQLAGGVVIDVVTPTGEGLEPLTVVAVLLTFVAVALAGRAPAALRAQPVAARRELPASSGDDGAADPLLAAALASGDALAVGSALVTARLLVPVTARVVRHGARGEDKESETEVALLARPDGTQAMLAFTSYATFGHWSRTLRPVRGSGATIAAEALERGLAALIVDVAGPAPHEVAGPALVALAGGRSPGVQARQVTLRLRAPRASVAVPALGPSVAEALALEVSTDGGGTWQAVIGVVPGVGVQPAELGAVAARAGFRGELLPLTGGLLERARQVLSAAEEARG